LEATYPNRLFIDKLLVGLKLWNGMNTSALSSECVVVVDSNHFASVGVDNIGTGNERYVGGAVLVIPFDGEGPCGVPEDKAHIAAGNATTGTATDHVNAGVDMSEMGYTVHDIGVAGLEAHDVVVSEKRTNDVTTNGDLGSWAGNGAGRCLSEAVGQRFLGVTSLEVGAID
jgi:hypothetical protein